MRFFLASESGERPLASLLVNYALALAALGSIVYISFYDLTSRRGWGNVVDYRRLFVAGWFATIWISAIALAGSSALGVALALARRSPVFFLRDTSRVYTEVIRGTPLLVQIYILYWGIFHRLTIESPYMAGALILAGFHGAYIGEIVRAGIEGIGKSQLDSARAIGLTGTQTFCYVVFPQMIRRILPPLAGEFASLIKNSSLLSVIGVNEFTQAASNTNAYTFSTLESYFPLAIGYLVLTLPISLWTQAMERRTKFET
ncbi:MAG TPA: amino acid ABC transporter permease [Chthoniobacteraceae bacterium]|nr:amino acid ABC transporter permease [Chthoniobacteraceae bacterium]